MKRQTALVFFFVTGSLLVAVPGWAQQPSQGRMGPMMNGPMMTMPMMQAMHQQMMQHPLHRQSMQAFVLPVLADTLDLSEEQQRQLEELKTAMTTEQQQRMRQMQDHQRQLRELFDSENVDDENAPVPEAVRRHLTAMAELRAQHQAALYETAHAMRQVLTEEQREVLTSMTPQQQMQQMMTRMTMMEMMEMMRAMHGGMMGQGMMQGTMPGMRGQGMMGSGRRMPRRPSQ